MITLDDFKTYLIEHGYAEFSKVGNPSTVYDYQRRVETIRKEKGFENFDDMAKEIDAVTREYDRGGKYADLGKRSHTAYISALKQFKEFVGSM